MAFITENGVITFKSEVSTGVSKAGKFWQSQTIVVSRDGLQAPFDKIALKVMGDKVNVLSYIKVGDKVEVVYSVSAREYNGNWYNDVNLFKVTSQGVKPAAAPEPTPNPAIFGNMEEEDDLPFA